MERLKYPFEEQLIMIRATGSYLIIGGNIACFSGKKTSLLSLHIKSRGNPK